MHTIMSQNHESDCTKALLSDIFRNMNESTILLNSHVRESLFTRLHLYLFLGKKRSEDTNKNLYLEKLKCELWKIQIRWKLAEHNVFGSIKYLCQWYMDRSVPGPTCPLEWSADNWHRYDSGGQNFVFTNRMSEKVEFWAKGVNSILLA